MASADEYAAWIVANEAKKGTPEFETVTQAYQLAKNEKPAAISVGDSLRQIPRQVGLTVREGAEGLADTAGIVTEPIRMVLNPVLRAAGLPGSPSTREMVSGAADAVGLPSPQGANERVVGDVVRMMAGGGGLGKASQVASEVVANPVAKAVTSAMGANQGTQAISAAGAGAAGGSVREAGGGPWEQFGASLVGGLTAAGASALAQKAYTGIADAVGSLLRPKQDITTVNVTLNQILQENGYDVSKIPANIRAELSSEVKKALDAGKTPSPDVVRRLADYGVVGATPTRGTVTLDPATITQEMNTSKAGMNMTDPTLHRLGNIKNENNKVFIENLNTLGGNTANADPRTAAGRIIDAISGQNEATNVTKRAAYDKARDSSGRQIDLDRDGFVFDAYRRLGESNKSAFLPAEIKSLLEQIRAGKLKIDGQELPVPFNVDVIDSLETTLASASRGAKDGNVKMAIANVRDALNEVKPRATGAPVGGNQLVDPTKLSAAQTRADGAASDSMSAFEAARRVAKGQFDWQKSAPGIAAALDDPNPDRFVHDFILSNTNKASTANVEKLMDTLHNQPQAKQAAKENVVAWLKSKALGSASDEVGNFSQSGYNGALNQLGDKLRLFFDKDEIAQLRALGRVSSYDMVQPKGSAVNNSNTAGGLAGLLDKIASSKLVSRIPFAEPALQGPARNWSAQIGTNRALDAKGALVAPEQSKEMMRLEQLFGPGFLLAAPRADGRDNEKRR